METLIYIGVGIVIGLYVMYNQIQLKLVNNKIDATIDTIPTANDLAKEILNLKIPMEELPSDTVEMLKKEELARKKNKDNSYFG